MSVKREIYQEIISTISRDKEHRDPVADKIFLDEVIRGYTRQHQNDLTQGEAEAAGWIGLVIGKQLRDNKI